MKSERASKSEIKKRSKKSLSEDRQFVLWRGLMCLILCMAVIGSILDKSFCIVHWPDDYNDVVGVSSQIITSIISLVVSIIGIAISLQNEEFFGIKITKLYGLRVTKHYSTLEIIIISIFLCAINMACYMLNLIIAAIGTLLVAFIFLIQVVRSEVPIMSKSEKALIDILKNNIIDCYYNDREASKDLKDAVRYLIYTKNLREVYDSFKEDLNHEYNQHLILKLLEYQHDLAFEIIIKYDENEQRKIADSLLENILDVIFRHIDVSNETYSEICKNKYLITRVLFRIHELPSMQKRWLGKVQGLFQCLQFTSEDAKRINELISEIIIILVSETVKHGDFSIIKSIRRQLSGLDYYCLDEENAALDTFAVLSMFLYYLSCSEEDVPDELKKQISEFINESGIEEDTKIISWKGLFQRAARLFKVDYARFISLASKSTFDMEYYLSGEGAKNVVLGEYYFSFWYFTNWFNAQNIYGVNFENFCSTYHEAKTYLIDFSKKCINENGDFVPSEEMNRIVKFYDDSDDSFAFFIIDEEREHSYFKFVNNARYEQLSENVAKAVSINNYEFAEKIRKGIEETLTREWGFDSTLPIENQSRYFSIIFEKVPEAINFEECISDYCKESVISDLKKSINRTLLVKGNDFEEGIQQILKQDPKYTTANVKKTIPYFFIRDEKLKEEFIKACDSMTEIDSKLLGDMFIMLNDSFKFNFTFEKIEITDLSEDDISKKVDSYQRADGQFVYEGVFLPREAIIEIVRKRFVVLTIIMKHQVLSSGDSIYSLKPYSSC